MDNNARFLGKSSGPSRHVLVANCGEPKTNADVLLRLFRQFDPAASLTFDHRPGHRCFISLATPEAAAAAQAELQGTSPPELGGSGPLLISFAECRDERQGAERAQDPALVALRSAAVCGIEGLSLLLDFVRPAEEEALLLLADRHQDWQLLAKRRVLHFGRTFDYEARGLGPAVRPLPPAALRVAARIERLPGGVAIDQLTVNEYPPGVGISPHVETHSAFTGPIASLSLAGPAVMVFRRPGCASRAMFLPPRSLLVLDGEARYCWQHYIPHRKSDEVEVEAGGGLSETVPRAARRMSFTFRKTRGFPCACAYPEFCDSQLAPLEPTRMAMKRLAAQAPASAAAAPGGLDAGRSQQSFDDGQLSGPSAPEVAAPAAGEGEAGQPAHADDMLREQQEQLPGYGLPTQQGHICGRPPTPQHPEVAGQEQLSLDAHRQAALLEQRHVHNVYDAIAPHFAATRFAVWPRVRAFLESLPPGAVVADVGCGNGKYFGVKRGAYVLGIDRSEKLARVAAGQLQPAQPGRRRLADVAVADGLALPYREASCDGALCIAVIHHIALPARRLAFLAQLVRVLRTGGRAFLAVWATKQENMRRVRRWQRISAPAEVASGVTAAVSPEPVMSRVAGAGAQQGTAAEQEAVAGGDYFVPWHLPLHRPEAAAAARHVSSCLPASGAEAEPRLDGRTRSVVMQRYYHLFEEGGLEELVAQVPGAAVVESFYDKDNWCCVLERVPT